MLSAFLVFTILSHVQCDTACANTTSTSDFSITNPVQPVSKTYIGFGPVSVECFGKGDNWTTVRWIRFNKFGISSNLTSAISHFLNFWSAKLRDYPPNDQFPYTYHCVISHKCYPNITSPGQTVYGKPDVPSDQTKGCPNFEFSGTTIKIVNTKDKSVDVSWSHILRQKDTGFKLEWAKATSGKVISKIFPVNATKYTITGLAGCYQITKANNIRLHIQFPHQVRIAFSGTIDNGEGNGSATSPILTKLETKIAELAMISDPVLRCRVPNTTYHVRIYVLFGINCTTIPVHHPFKTKTEACSFDFVHIIPKHSNITSTSAIISWKYTLRPKDTGFQVSWRPVGSSRYANVLLNRTEKSYEFTGLIPYTKYDSKLFVRTGYTCLSIAITDEFNTLQDNPGLPRNVKANRVNSTNINVTWLEPKFPNGPNLSYRLFYKIDKLDKKFNVINISTGYSYFLKNLKERASYLLQMMAINSHGNGNKTKLIFIPVPTTLPPRTTKPTTLVYESTKPATLIYETTKLPTPATQKTENGGSVVGIAVGVVVVVFVFLLVLVFCFLRKRKMKRLRQQSIQTFRQMHGVVNDEHFGSSLNRNLPLPMPDTNSKNFEAPDEVSYIVLLDDWELLRENLKILEKKLGGGQFGIVKQGLFSTGKKTDEAEVVAVKMLKDTATANDRQDLLTEIKILKEVNKEPHPNVLRLIGACTQAEPLLLVMEFCSGGNLRKFLINSRVDVPEKSPTYVNLSSTLTHRQLLKIAADVASGMMHLASFKFIHRDLAARNVLIGEDDTAKLADFGLARDISQDEEYVRANQNLLPVKWMALESLLDGRFSTASDIWSYGVLLYEITTLGEEPYKGISPYNIVSHVGSGCRMEKPPHCSERIYTIMKSCWKVDPSERPTFENVHKELLSMLLDEEFSRYSDTKQRQEWDPGTFFLHQNTYINITQTVDEGPLRTSNHNLSVKDGAVRYTTA